MKYIIKKREKSVSIEKNIFDTKKHSHKSKLRLPIILNK